MKKKLIRIITWIILIVLVLLWFFTYKQMSDYTKIIKLNRWIEIPKELGYKELYSKDQWASFHWDWLRYHVYSYENEEIVNNMLDWKNALHDEQEKSWGYFNIEDRERELNIYVRYIPPLSHIINVYYKKKKDNSEILILLNDIEKEIYIFESFL